MRGIRDSSRAAIGVCPPRKMRPDRICMKYRNAVWQDRCGAGSLPPQRAILQAPYSGARSFGETILNSSIPVSGDLGQSGSPCRRQISAGRFDTISTHAPCTHNSSRMAQPNLSNSAPDSGQRSPRTRESRRTSAAVHHFPGVIAAADEGTGHDRLEAHRYPLPAPLLELSGLHESRHGQMGRRW